MSWADGVRELTNEEKQKILDYLTQRGAERFYDKILGNEYLAMDFLEHAEKDDPLDYTTIMYIVVDECI